VKAPECNGASEESMTGTPTPAAPRRIGIAELERRLGRDKTTIWRWYMASPPRFPAPHFIGERRAWWLHEVEAWEREQMARPPEARRGARNLAGEAKP
jgi:predicted DNA-binding transcriptional regulator AlpA